MTLTMKEIDVLEDLRVLAVARAQRLCGIDTARKYSELLTQRSTAALTSGYIDDAIRIAEREFEFTSSYFGLEHQYSRASVLDLQALRTYKRVMADAVELLAAA